MNDRVGRVTSAPQQQRSTDGVEQDQSASATEGHTFRSGPSGRAMTTPAARESSTHPSVRRDRALYAVLMHAPFAILLLFLRQDQVMAVTHQYVSPLNAAVFYLPLVVGVAYQESFGGSAKLLLVDLFCLGCVMGACYPAVADAPFVRLLCVVALGWACGQLRLMWATRRLSRRIPHRITAHASNFFKRTGGIAPALVVGEVVGCVVWVEGGWAIVSQSWYGYILSSLFPLCLMQVASFTANFLTSVFGGDRRHVVGRSDATRLEIIRWTATVTAATTLLIVAIVVFVVTYVPYAWTNQLLMSPYALAMDVVSFRALKGASRARRGRELYKAHTRKHDQLISDVLSRSKDYHCH